MDTPADNIGTRPPDGPAAPDPAAPATPAAPDTSTAPDSAPGAPAVPLPGHRVGPGRAQWPVLAVISLGGAIGATARYGAALLWPTASGAFPWTTLLVNAVGCAVIGAFLVTVTEGRPAHPLLRPFFGTGVLGGFTTFSTYVVDAQRLLTGGQAGTALVYLVATLAAALTSVWAAAKLTRRLLERRTIR